MQYLWVLNLKKKNSFFNGTLKKFILNISKRFLKKNQLKKILTDFPKNYCIKKKLRKKIINNKNLHIFQYNIYQHLNFQQHF